MVLVIAYVREKGTGARDEKPGRSGHLEADGDTYEQARTRILDQLTDGWIVATSWCVDGP